MTLQQMHYAVLISESGSINEAAKKLYISQPTLSSSVRDLETELGITLFVRGNRGITVTPEGEEFLGYARQMLEQYRLLEDRYLKTTERKRYFSVSTQHYSFAVEAFIRVANSFGMDHYEFAIHETRTGEVIRNVSTMRSEIGILYLNDFNRKALTKLISDADLEFVPLFDCSVYVFLWEGHPLAKNEKIRFEELASYPCLSFDQGEENSFYFAEEVLSTQQYSKIIKANDRATMLNLMHGLNGYTLCSGIICQELNGDMYTSVPLDSSDTMTIGYLKKKRVPLSSIARRYVEELETFEPAGTPEQTNS